MPVPRIAAIHDLSCYGRCALTIAMPVLSAMGCQCCPLPTALLSTHTAFPGGSFLDLTSEMEHIAAHWSELDVQFDAIYSGFLGSAAQIRTVQDFIRQFRRADCPVIIDPVMGDHGQAYRTCTPELCQGLRTLAEQADVITPNLTEAALLLEISYEEIQKTDMQTVVRQLNSGGRRSVVLTGYSAAAGQTGALCYDRDSREVYAVQVLREPTQFHGTGDLFASVLTGALASNASLEQAARQAAEFVRTCVAHTAAQATPSRDGVAFEPLLGQLMQKATSAQ